MSKAGLQQRITAQLAATNVIGGYHGSIVCTHTGLLVASDGEILSDEMLAGFTSLFDDIVHRAQRDLELRAVDEVTLLDGERGRLVIRTIRGGGEQRMFLVVAVPAKTAWRRNTNRLLAQLQELLRPMLHYSGDGPGDGA